MASQFWPQRFAVTVRSSRRAVCIHSILVPVVLSCGVDETLNPVRVVDEVPSLNPAVDLDPAPGRVVVSLVARELETRFAGDSPKVWAYLDAEAPAPDRAVPGPLIEANVGDEVVVRIQNDLLESTTVHFHGLRLDSMMDGAANHGDSIRPGESFEARFIARDPGVFWYHPHVHADEQIERGMYGVLVVRDRAAEPGERIFVLDDVNVEGGEIVVTPTMEDLEAGRVGDRLLVNGGEPASLLVAPGSVERWTFISAANARHLVLRLEGSTFDIVAGDAFTLPVRRPATELLIAPGERWTIEVPLAGEPGEMLELSATTLEGGHSSEKSTLARPLMDVRLVEGEPTLVTPLLPTPLAPFEVPPAEVRTLELSSRIEAGEKPRFYINGEAWPFNEPLCGRAGDLEFWDVVNREDAEHPFHVHGMFFQVLDDGGSPDESLGWKDTLRVPAQSSRRIALQLEPGDWMFHCQIPEHAEAGMMGEIRVEP